MTITATVPKRSQVFSFGRYQALAIAEMRQYFRNKTLVLMAALFPVGVGVLMLYMNNTEAADDQRVRAAVAMEVFFLLTFMFVQYYSVLSMTTTRRDEKVLKRLRTGEAKDIEVVLAIATPGAVVSVFLTVVMIAVVYLITGVLPYFGMNVVVVVIFGVVISTALALVTSSVTPNAEAAQLTSLPVMVLAMLSQSTMRLAMPEEVQRFIDRTPFALITDLSFSDFTGGTLSEITANTGVATLSLLALLIGWAIGLSWLAVKYMKWETNR